MSTPGAVNIVEVTWENWARDQARRRTAIAKDEAEVRRLRALVVSEPEHAKHYERMIGLREKALSNMRTLLVEA